MTRDSSENKEGAKTTEVDGKGLFREKNYSTFSKTSSQGGQAKHSDQKGESSAAKMTSDDSEETKEDANTTQVKFLTQEIVLLRGGVSVAKAGMLIGGVLVSADPQPTAANIFIVIMIVCLSWLADSGEYLSELRDSGYEEGENGTLIRWLRLVSLGCIVEGIIVLAITCARKTLNIANGTSAAFAILSGGMCLSSVSYQCFERACNRKGT